MVDSSWTGKEAMRDAWCESVSNVQWQLWLRTGQQALCLYATSGLYARGVNGRRKRQLLPELMHPRLTQLVTGSPL